jgi:hypothetical protein
VKPAKLPTASPRNVREVLRVIQRAADDDEFKQGYLQQRGVGQFKQGLQLVRFLDLLSSVRTLKADVLATRPSPPRLAQLLADRLRAACCQAGCSEHDVAFLAADELGPAELDRRLHNLPPIKREKSDVLRSNMVHCLQALHEFLRALARESTARVEPPPAAAPFTVAESLGRLLESRAKSFEVCEVIEEVVDYTPDHTAIKARVHFDVPVRQAHLIRLAKLLLERAGTLAEHPPASVFGTR